MSKQRKCAHTHRASSLLVIREELLAYIDGRVVRRIGSAETGVSGNQAALPAVMALALRQRISNLILSHLRFSGATTVSKMDSTVLIRYWNSRDDP